MRHIGSIKPISTATIRFIVTVDIVVYKGLIPVVYRMLTDKQYYLHCPSMKFTC